MLGWTSKITSKAMNTEQNNMRSYNVMNDIDSLVNTLNNDIWTFASSSHKVTQTSPVCICQLLNMALCHDWSKMADNHPFLLYCGLAVNCDQLLSCRDECCQEPIVVTEAWIVVRHELLETNCCQEEVVVREVTNCCQGSNELLSWRNELLSGTNCCHAGTTCFQGRILVRQMFDVSYFFQWLLVVILMSHLFHYIACFMRILASGVTNFDSEKHPTNFDKLKEGVQYSFEQLTAYDLRPVADQQLIGTTVPCSGSASHRYRNTYE